MRMLDRSPTIKRLRPSGRQKKNTDGSGYCQSNSEDETYGMGGHERTKKTG